MLIRNCHERRSIVKAVPIDSEVIYIVIALLRFEATNTVTAFSNS